MQITSSWESYQNRARAMLELWAAEIAHLRSKVYRQLQAGARSEAMQRLEELETLYRAALEQYEAMQHNSRGRVDDLRKTFEQSTDRLRQKFDELIQQIA